jgi:hypothetical protein
MLLRTLVLFVLFVNVLLYAYGSGQFGAVAIGPWSAFAQREPERVAQQLHPERIVLRAPPAAAPLCLQSPGNAAAAQESLRAALRAAGYRGEVQTSGGEETVRYMVFMGKYADEPQLQAKLAELKRLNIGEFAAVGDDADYQPGISLGVFRERERAQARLAQLGERGVRTARIVERKSSTALTLRLPDVPPAQRAALGAALERAGGRPLEPCAAASAS